MNVKSSIVESAPNIRLLGFIEKGSVPNLNNNGVKKTKALKISLCVSMAMANGLTGRWSMEELEEETTNPSSFSSISLNIL